MSRPSRHVRGGQLEDDLTGETAPATIDELASTIKRLEQDLDLAERALREERRRRLKLESDKARERLNHAQRLVIEDVFAEWVQVAERGKGTKLGPKRFDAIAARLVEGRERWQFSLVILYGVRRPYVKNGVRYDDIELLCRDEVRFERALYGCWHAFPVEAKALMPSNITELEAAKRKAARTEVPTASQQQVPQPDTFDDLTHQTNRTTAA